jgi:hypothetical protein
MSEPNYKIYRSVEAKPDTTTKLRMPKTTMRPPGNVHYVVDNLWEWKRPENYPNRRHSVFASPTPELALKAAKGGTVYTVEFNGRCNLCQVRGHDDSKEHPDRKDLRKLLFKIFGQHWIDGNLKDREILEDCGFLV